MAPIKKQHPNDLIIRRLITNIIRRCPKKREQIAEEMGARLGQHITVHMLNSYTSDSNLLSRFPAQWVEAFSEIVGSDRLERHVISKRNSDLLEFGEAAKKVLTACTRRELTALRKLLGRVKRRHR